MRFSSTSFAGRGAAEWMLGITGSRGSFGTGYWSVTVPEPSSVILASLGCVCGIAYVRSRICFATRGRMRWKATAPPRQRG
jgi:hypothetical protein